MQRFFKLSIFFAVFYLFFLFCPASAEQGQNKRIISLTPASTEILFALGLEDEIIGVSSYCDWPPQARRKESVGSFSNPNIEKIVSLKPDLVFLTGLEQERLKTILSKLGIDYAVLHPSNLKELILSIEKTAKLTGREKEGRILINNIKDVMRRIETAVSKIPEKDRPRVYLEFWHDPVMTVGGNSFINDMIETAGGINIAGDLKRSYSRIDPEVVILRNPNVIILTYHIKNESCIKKIFTGRIGWQDIDAVKNNRIFQDINPDLILRPGPRVIEGLTELYKRFYEE